MAFGLALLGWNLHRMSAWTPDISGFELTSVLVVRGFAMGQLFPAAASGSCKMTI